MQEREDPPAHVLRPAAPPAAVSSRTPAAAAPEAPPEVHPTAVVDGGAELGPGCTVEAHAVVGAGVRLAARVRVGAHAVLSGPLEIGDETRVWPGAVLGGEPQMHRYRDGGTARIGPRCQLREFATVHRGSEEGHVTVVEEGVLMMASSHVAHDCHLAPGAVLSGSALVAGHAWIGECAILSGNVLVHQFARIGTRAMIAGGARVARDVPPFALLQGDSEVVGVNWVGLRRAGASREVQREIRELYGMLFARGTTLERAVEDAAGRAESAEGRALVAFFREPSKRGFCRGRLERGADDCGTSGAGSHH